MRKSILVVAMAAMISAPVYADCTAVAVETDFSKFDLTGDGVVDMADFEVFRGVFGSSGDIGDFNDDDIVNLSDFSLFRGALLVHETTTVVRCSI